MDEGKNLIEMTKELLSAYRIDKVNDSIDSALVYLTDHIDILDNIETPLKSVVAVFSYAKKHRVKAFLKRYAERVDKSIDLSSNDFARLTKYMGNDKNVQFVAETIDSALNSRSVTCSAILGYFAGSILSETKAIEYKDLIAINALKIMVDEDLDNFLTLYDLILNNPAYRQIEDQHHVGSFEELDGRHFVIEMTVEKLKSIQVVGYKMGGPWTPSGWGIFLFNENSDYLYDVIVKAGAHSY